MYGRQNDGSPKSTHPDCQNLLLCYITEETLSLWLRLWSFRWEITPWTQSNNQSLKVEKLFPAVARERDVTMEAVRETHMQCETV